MQLKVFPTFGPMAARLPIVGRGNIPNPADISDGTNNLWASMQYRNRRKSSQSDAQINHGAGLVDATHSDSLIEWPGINSSQNENAVS